MTSNIKRLSDSMINKIAAGEVVERPAAAIKELIENALDAQATDITIHIQEGGKRILRVSDNGTGMTREDLPLSVERHATSKMDEDILAIHHFGFRGEALASIASVSRMVIKSKQKDTEGCLLEINAGKINPIRPTAMTVGTHVDVQDLFYTTPARLKFLQSDRAETMAITDIVKRLAMANPNVSFTLTDSSTGKIRTLFQTRKETGDLLDSHLQRISAVLGKDFIKNCLYVETSRDGVFLSGWIGLPGAAKGTTKSQHLFVNNRPVRDKTLAGALRAAYQDTLAYGRHAPVALFLKAENDTVDVNVHPAKEEVRFKNAGHVRGLLISTIRTALLERGHKGPTQTLEAGNNWSPQRSFAQAPVSNIAPQRSFIDDAPAAQNQTQTEEVYSSQEYPLGSAISHLYDTYILARTADSLILVDAHAAHERIVYEKLKKQWRSGTLKSQPLLIPDIIDLDKDDIQTLLDHQEDLMSLGIDIESFGGTSLLVRSLPIDIQNSKELLLDCLSALEEGKAKDAIEIKKDALASSIACHGSVRSGRRLKPEEMNALLREIEQTPNSGQCNHGRPTSVCLTKKEIDKLFGRS